VSRYFGIKWLISIILLVSPRLGSATQFTANPDNYLSILTALQAGDTIKLAAGNYLNGLDLSEMNGNDQAWFRIEGPSNGPGAIFTTLSDRSTIIFKNSSFVQVSGIEILGNPSSAHHAIELTEDADYAHHIVLEELHIHGFTRESRNAAIITSAPAWDWIIRLNTIEDVGTGLQLGNNRTPSQFIRGTIEQNAILQPLSYAIFIAAQSERPDVMGVPRQRTITFVRHNVLSKASPARTNITGRPLLQLESQPTTGFAENDDYQVYGNFFFENAFRGQALLLGEGNLRVHNNIFVNSKGNALEFRQLTNPVRELDVFNNTIISGSVGIKIEDVDQAFEQRVIGNAVFATEAIINPQGQTQNNLSDNPSFVSNYLQDPERLNYFPLPDALSGLDIDLEYFVTITDYNLDFDGTQRTGNTRGAYYDDGDHSGWVLNLGRKNREISEGHDAGFSDSSGGDVGLTDTGSNSSRSDGGQVTSPGTNMTDSAEASSCGCRASPYNTSHGFEYLLLLGLVVLIRRRRKV